MLSDDRQQRFLRISDQYKGVIARVCKVYASENTPFADLYQEVMINLWLGLESWRGEAKLSTWIYRIALNTCITWQRRDSRRSSIIVYDDQASDIIDPAFSDDTPNESDLYTLINKLNPFDKALITLWLDEKPYDEIAQILGISKSNVATRLNRIRTKMSMLAQSTD